MKTFDASHDMPEAARRRNEILDSTPSAYIAETLAKSAAEKLARSRRYVELRLQGLSQDAAEDQVFDELAAPGMVRRCFENEAASDEYQGIATLDELRERVGL